jgi:AcrR family transcriptional regulator
MARTVDAAAHAARREEFLDAFGRLVATKGYANASTQDVLTELGASRGSLYHYFGSKRDLLTGLVARSVAASEARLRAVLEDGELSAVAKLNRFLGSLADWKTVRRNELVAAMRIRRSDENALVNQALRTAAVERIAPLLAEVVAQGVRERVFTAPHPELTGRMLVALLGDLEGALFDLFFAVESGDADLAAVERASAAYTDAVERILGAPAGSVTLVDPGVLRAWFPDNTRKGRQK